MAQDGTVAYVTKLPDCDFCVQLAQYDFKTISAAWANGCETHYEVYRMHRELGVGKGQKLVVKK